MKPPSRRPAALSGLPASLSGFGRTRCPQEGDTPARKGCIGVLVGRIEVDLDAEKNFRRSDRLEQSVTCGDAIVPDVHARVPKRPAAQNETATSHVFELKP
ncbi:MAG: hypothetical protein ABL982_20900 [Vicinamibacterales bacterium]